MPIIKYGHILHIYGPVDPDYEEEFGDEYKELHKKHLIPFIW